MKFMWIFLFHVALQSFQNLNPVVFPHTKNKDQQGYAQPGPCKLLEELQGNNEWVKIFPAHTHIPMHTSTPKSVK